MKQNVKTADVTMGFWSYYDLMTDNKTIEKFINILGNFNKDKTRSIAIFMKSCIYKQEDLGCGISKSGDVVSFDETFELYYDGVYLGVAREILNVKGQNIRKK